MGTRASTGAAVALGAAAAWELSRRVDGRRIARDPEHRRLSAPPAGRARTVANASPARVAFCEEMVLSCRRQVRAGAGATLSRLDLREGVASLTVPTLVLAGERDRLTPPVHARQLAEALPDVVELVEVSGAGHMAPVEQPDAVNRRLAALLAGVEHGAPVAPGGAGD